MGGGERARAAGGRTGRRRWPRRAWPAAVTLVAWAARLWRLDHRPLWWDEGISVYLAHQGTAAILADRAGDVHPPLYFVLLKGWTALVGPSVVAGRLFSVLPATLAVPALAAVGTRLAGRRVGATAGLLAALAAFPVQHAQEIRMYSLVPLVVLLATAWLVRVRTTPAGPGRAAGWAGYAAAIAAGPWLHYYTLAVPPFHAAALAASGERRAAVWRRWIAAQAAAAILFAPWLVRTAGRLAGNAAGKAAAESDPSVSLAAFAWRYVAEIGAGAAGDAGSPALRACAVVLAGLAIGGAARWWRRSPPRSPAAVAWPLAWLGVPLAAGYAVNLWLPFDAFARLLAYAAPGFYLLAAAGAAALGRGRAARAAQAVLVAVLAGLPLWRHQSASIDAAEDPRPLVAALAAEARPADVVVVDFPWQAGYMLAYWPPAVPPPRWYTAPGAAWGAEAGRMERDLDALTAAHARLWYPAYQALGRTTGRNVEGYLTAHAYPAADRWFGSTRLLLYGGTVPPAPAGLPAPARFEGGITLASAAVGPAEARPGDVVAVALVWRAAAAPAERLTVFVHVVDADGRPVAQHDAEPAGGGRPTDTWRAGDAVADRHGARLPADAAPGRYRVIAGLYRPATGERLRLAGAGGPDHAVLGTVRVGGE